MIPVLDLKAQYSRIKDEIEKAVTEVFASGEFILGSAVGDLEEQVARYCGCTFGIGVASGTDALRLSVTALGIGPGDEVVTTPFTFVATAAAISRSGARPVFADVDPQTFNIDPWEIKKVMNQRTKAILPVHLFGQPADMEAIIELASTQGLLVIGDAAQTIGARYKGRPVCSLGNLSCLSFYPTKNLGAYGDGGMVLTSDPDLADRVDLLRRQGSRKKYEAEMLGFNSRLDTLQAAVLLVKLKHLDEWNEARRRLAHRYNQLLSGTPVTTPYERDDVYHVYHQYTVLAPERDGLAAHLKNRGIGTMIYYPRPLHRQPLYADPEYGRSGLPVSERLSKEVLSLPLYPELTEEEQNQIAGAVREFYNEA